MRQAFACARRAEGSVSPNPRVGCVLVRDDAVVGYGFHRGPGTAHAEGMAIEIAGDAARGADAYVSLEPCAHHGHTPPCADSLIGAGVRRVVAASQDPDPRVNGRGLEKMRAAGIEVEVGCLADEAERLNEGFFRWHREQLPSVTLKAATTLDGRLSARDGESRWISSAASRRWTHRLRWEHDAILVGAETVRKDNPRLSVRLPNQQPIARRAVIWSRSGRLDPSLAIFQNPEVELFLSQQASPPELAAMLHRPTDSEDWEVRSLLQQLGSLGVRRLLVEGGGATLRAFIESGLATQLLMFQAPLVVGAEGAVPLVAGAAVDSPRDGWRWQREASFDLGGDQVGCWRPRCLPD